jgi:SAM-dependent methyltransferase
LCARERRFRATPGESLRESLACESCGCIARQRATASLLLEGLPRTARVHLTEQASVLYLALRRHLPRLSGSEWESSLPRRLRLSAWLWRHGAPGWIRREDVTALGFADAGLDAVASLDVLEHVPDYRRALAEFARVLRPGGRLVLCVPWSPVLEGVETLAAVGADGAVTHLRPPEYHGDPLGGGVLCFHHFGSGLPDAIREAGFDDVEPVAVQDPAAGLPQPVWVIRAVRSRNRLPPAPPGR